MGCLLAKLAFWKSHSQLEEEEQPKQYSWDKKPTLDVSDYMYDGVKDQTVGKLPGSINGEQFIIQNCQNCNIYIFDHTSTVTVDDCVDCNFFIGPIRTSIFIRDCTGCKFVVSCQQFRTRDCQKLEAFLCCTTQPIIEASSGVRLACYNYYYPELDGQFQDAGLSVFNNNWSNIHDFSQDPTEKHYTLLPEETKVEDLVPLPVGEDFEFLQIELHPDKSVVPRSLGTRRKIADESCLVVFFYDVNAQRNAMAFIAAMRCLRNCVLVQTKALKMTTNDAERVFSTNAYNDAIAKGEVIGMEYNGDGSIQCCQQTIGLAVHGDASPVFISGSREEAAQEIENYYNFADMQMGV